MLCIAIVSIAAGRARHEELPPVVNRHDAERGQAEYRYIQVLLDPAVGRPTGRWMGAARRTRHEKLPPVVNAHDGELPGCV